MGINFHSFSYKFLFLILYWQNMLAFRNEKLYIYPVNLPGGVIGNTEGFGLSIGGSSPPRVANIGEVNASPFLFYPINQQNYDSN